MTRPARYQWMTGETTWGSGSRACTFVVSTLLIGCRYQRAFVDFFEDQLVAKKYDWKALLREFMFEGDQPLINGLVSGRKYERIHFECWTDKAPVAHPLIHLGYAYELNSRTVAIEALALSACFYGSLHKYIDDPKYARPSPVQATSLLDILAKVREDKRFDGLYKKRSGDISKVLGEQEDVFLEYFNAWELSDPRKQFEESQQVAVAILAGTDAAEDSRFDFFFVHVLTSSHAVRLLLPCIPATFHISLVRQWWLFTLAVYIAQTRPEIKLGRITDYDVQGRDWKFVLDTALRSSHSMDAHFVKALRSIKVASETWGDGDGFYLKAAVQVADEFERWGGFETSEDDVAHAYPELQ
ncbi:hypothetical protein PMIN02_011746 [Paraphaeosphaeria minitans]